MDINCIYAPIERELSQLEEEIKENLDETDYPLIQEFNTQFLEIPGKRLRPAFTFLAAKAAGGDVDEKLIKMAAGVEILHLASLVHDDIVDRAETRRGIPTLNQTHGMEISLIYGDYLIAAAFQTIAVNASNDIIQLVGEYVREGCGGEMLQLKNRGNMELSEGVYNRIIAGKTAALTRAACEMGAMHVGSEQAINFAGYGFSFGMTYQIMDDYLDIADLHEARGKNAGEDIKVGELTLPMIMLADAIRLEGLEFSTWLAEQSGDLDIVRGKLIEHNIYSRVKERMLSYAADARGALLPINDTQYKKSLLGVVDLVLSKVEGLHP